MALYTKTVAPIVVDDADPSFEFWKDTSGQNMVRITIAGEPAVSALVDDVFSGGVLGTLANARTEAVSYAMTELGYTPV